MKHLVIFLASFFTAGLFAQTDKVVVKESDSIRIEYQLLANTDSICERRIFKLNILIDELHVQRRIRVGE